MSDEADKPVDQPEAGPSRPPTGTGLPAGIDVMRLLGALPQTSLAPIVSVQRRGPAISMLVQVRQLGIRVTVSWHLVDVVCVGGCHSAAFSLTSSFRPPCRCRCWIDYGKRDVPGEYEYEYEDGEGPSPYRFASLEGFFVMAARGTPEFIHERMRQVGTMDREDLEDLYDAELEAREAKQQAQREAELAQLRAAHAEREKLRQAKAAELARAAWQEKLPADGGGRVIRPDFSSSTPRRPPTEIILQIGRSRPPTLEERLANRAELYSLADSIEDPLVRLHNHMLRVFAPGLTMLGAAPAVWTADGQAWKLMARARTLTLEAQQLSAGSQLLTTAGDFGRKVLRRLGVLEPSDGNASQ